MILEVILLLWVVGVAVLFVVLHWHGERECPVCGMSGDERRKDPWCPRLVWKITPYQSCPFGRTGMFEGPETDKQMREIQKREDRMD